MESYYHYWGKARRADDGGEGPEYHRLVYHSLDVAAVAKYWLQSSHTIRSVFSRITGLNEQQASAWVLFFVALHDLGKYDVRFQLKVPSLAGILNYAAVQPLPDPVISRKYWHGEYAVYWVFHDLAEHLQWVAEDPWDEAPGEALWKAWQPWIRAVAGHHGVEPAEGRNPDGTHPQASAEIIDADHEARRCFIEAMETLFLHPVGLSFTQQPPPCDLEFLAGFCAVCDWLGSTTENKYGDKRFDFVSNYEGVEDYLNRRIAVARLVLAESGLLAQVSGNGGMEAVFPELPRPHQVQTLVDKLPADPGLTLIEAPTGSGKTEAALAYAARLLAQGQSESIIFALPTQATADAMLERLLDVAERLFCGTDIVLAHGKSRFNPLFTNLKKAAQGGGQQSPNHELEAGAQCALWLAQSRKRVFLGQIGVCTVDQVLVSVLPVRHRFVRGFGLGKSVLIVDEVHAYDAYMYGLLDQVLRHQRAMGGSTVLLSATLPLALRKGLLASWDASNDELHRKNDYPLITQADACGTRLYGLPEAERLRLAEQAPRDVQLAWQETADMLPDDSLEQAIIDAARNGANVVVVCNLVADAQSLAERLGTRCKDNGAKVTLFHSRYRFRDRQQIQQEVMQLWGKDEPRAHGGILVATQVIEQSLDLDFDWMISQLCPIDLLFQRLGRLHRHPRPRPSGFENPACTVLLPEANQYELHKLIYGNDKAPNARVMWRSEQLVRRHSQIRFPNAYRPMIEQVYDDAPWPDEPEEIKLEYEKFEQAEYASRSTARHISNIENAWKDDDSNVSLLTRDGEMSLSIVPVIDAPHGQCFLDDSAPIRQLEEWQQLEQIMRNTLPAPKSWQRQGLPDVSPEDGLVWLLMKPLDEAKWVYESPKAQFEYTVDYGLRMNKR